MTANMMKMFSKLQRTCFKKKKLRFLLVFIVFSVTALVIVIEHKAYRQHISVKDLKVRNPSGKKRKHEDTDFHFRFIESYVGDASERATDLIEIAEGSNNTEIKSRTKPWGKSLHHKNDIPLVLDDHFEAKLTTSKPRTAIVADFDSETQEQFLARMKKRMDNRRKHLRGACNSLGLTPPKESFTLWKSRIPQPTPWTFISKQYRLIYSEIPKSGCSHWKMVMMVLEGMLSVADLNNPEAEFNPHSAALKGVKFRGLTSNETALYQNSTKLVVVREPMERLVSAYLDKIAAKPPSNSSTFTKFSWEVAKKYGNRWNDKTEYFDGGYRKIRVCQSEIAELYCDDDYEVIRILSATYARTNNETCGSEPQKIWNGKSCFSKHAYFVTSQLCDGKQSCVVVASQSQFGMVSECSQAKKLLTILYKCASIKDSNIVTVCSEDSHKIKCPKGGVIAIASALYGRLNAKTCSYKSVTLNSNCVSPTATSSVLSACQFQSSCVVHARKEWIQSDPCPLTTKYLQVWYNCIGRSEAISRAVLQKFPLPLANSNVGVQFAPVPQAIYGDITNTNNKVNAKVQLKKPISMLSSSIYIPPIYQTPKYIFTKYNLSATFKEFVDYLIDPLNADVTNDVIDHGSPVMKMTSVRHWQSFHDLTHPCHLDYDVIAHMETIEEDARYLLHLIGAPADLNYPQGYDKESGKSKTTKDHVKELFKSLSDDDIKKLLQLYELDYKLFGYEFPSLR